MYRAKERGRNKVVSYCPEEDDARGLSESGSIAARLHKALGEGGFVLHYQPVIHLASGAVAYHEALVRLSDEHGLLYPSGFIPLAERLGLMPQLTAWILREAALALHGKPNLHLSLNLSGLDLSDGDLVGLVGAFLREHDLAPGRLRFEIAETAVIKDPALAERRIRPLAILGCPCALDDFGAGLVSLVHLDDLPVDQVKVDGAAVRGLAHDPVKRAFVRAMQGLCAGYGKETVAEWVENADVARAVQALGVTYGQGYYFGRPSPHLLDRPEPLPILPPR